MPNDFTDDADCVALWRFESGALITDTIGTNTLTNNNGVSENTVDFKEGACSADFEASSSKYLSIIDANLDAGFPLKNGDVNKKISVCGWFQIEATSQSLCIFSKYDSAGSKRSLYVGVNSSNEFEVYIGYNGGASAEEIYKAGSLVAGRMYHYGFTFQDSDKNWQLVVWDDTASSKIINTSGTAANNINIEDVPVAIGGLFTGGTPTNFYDGEIDEKVVFKDILTTGEIDWIRLGVYGPMTIVAGIGINAQVGTNWPEIIAGIGIGASVSTEQEAAISAGIGVEAVVNTEAYPEIVAGIGIEAEASVFNWVEWIAIYAGRFTTRYHFTLTGTPDGLADIALSFSSFQYRLRDNTPSYLQVVVPGTDDAQDIADRSNGELVIEMAYLVDGVEQHREQLARVDLEDITTYEGALRGSIILSGHRTETWGAQAVTLQGITYQSDYNGLIRVRCSAPDLWLRPGDTVNAGDETFVAGQVITAMSKNTHWMEVVEAE